MEAGVSAAQLRVLVACGLVLRVHRDTYAISTQFEALPDSTARHRIECAAVESASGQAVISHQSAALLHGLRQARSLGGLTPGSRVQVTIPGDHRSSEPAYDVCGSDLADEDVVELHGMRMTSLARTAIDVARRQRSPDAQVVVDSAARMMILELVSHYELREAVHDPQLRRQVLAQLKAACGRMGGMKGIPTARQAIKHADPAAEGALESISRIHILVSDLPRPKIGWPVETASGLTKWGDFYFEEEDVIGEADGKGKYTDEEVVYAEKRREDDLRDADHGVVRWNWHEGVVRPHLMLHRIGNRLAKRRKPQR